MNMLNIENKGNYATEAIRTEQVMKKAAGAEMQQPLSIFKGENSKVSSENKLPWICEDKNGVQRIDVTKLALYIRENVPYYYIQTPAGNTKKWYLYNESKYVKVSSDEVKGMIKSFVPPEAAKPSDINKVFSAISTDCFNSSHKLSPGEFDTDENIINFTNGIYDIRERTLKKHSPEYKSSLQIQCDYKPVSECENNGVFDAFINHFFNGNQEQIELMLQILGLSLSCLDATRAKQAVFILGDGNTGKSLLKKLAIKLIGSEYNSSIDLKTMETRFGSSALLDKRIAGSHDMSFEFVKELNTFKNITGGDSVNSEFKGQNYFELKFRGLLWFCCNQMPHFGGDRGDWVYSRICILKALGKVYDLSTEPFEGIVYRNPNLLNELWEEREYIVSRAIEALHKYIDNNEKFSTTELNDKYLEEYKRTNSSVISYNKIW